MTNPSGQSIVVAVETLRKAAKSWDDVHEHLNSAGKKADEQQMSRLQAGIFQIFWNGYQQAATYTRDRLNEGATEATKIGGVMRANADTYEAEERENEHALRNLY